MDEKNIEFICPECGKAVDWTLIVLSNGSEIKSPNWYCNHCGAETIGFANRNRIYIASEEQ